MNRYESVFILRPNLDEESTQAALEKFSGLVSESGGKLEKVDKWGKRKLAYPINDFNEGYYVILTFESDADFPKELERIYKISDEVIRYMNIRLED